MTRLTSHEVVVMFLALGTLLGAARILGELAKRLNQPAVLGEIFAGVLLGPTVLGWVAPAVHAGLFPPSGPLALVMNGLGVLAITLFLLVAGMEVDVSMLWRQGRVAMSVSAWGMFFPFAVGLAVALAWPRMMGREPGADPLVFALFFATALSISALPVIAKILMDLNIYRSDLGIVVIAAAVCNDLAGWIVFAGVLGMMGAGGGHGPGLAHTIWMTLALAAFMLTVVRWVLHRILPWLQAHTSWPGGVLSFALAAALFCAALTEWIGVHSVFGAFLFGVALGDSSHLRKETRSTIDRFISFFFAPLFFASIGLQVNFVANFDLRLVVVVLLIACFGKVVGCGVGARLGGMAWRPVWAVGFGMNARGAMEIILGLLALQAGVIRERMFVALVVVALVTSVMSGPAMQWLLRERKAKRFAEYLSGRTYVRGLDAADRWQAITRLAEVVAKAHGLDAAAVAAAVIGREQIMATGMGQGIAIPHARLPGIAAPIVAVGISGNGVDFDAPDGAPARLIVMILTPAEDAGAHLGLLADVSRSFSDADAVERALACGGYTEFLAVLRSMTSEG